MKKFTVILFVLISIFFGDQVYGNQHPGVKKAVNELLGTPEGIFNDGSWIKILS